VADALLASFAILQSLLRLSVAGAQQYDLRQNLPFLAVEVPSRQRFALGSLQTFLAAASKTPAHWGVLKHRYGLELAVAQLLSDTAQPDGLRAEKYAAARSLAEATSSRILEAWSSLSPLHVGPRQLLLQVCNCSVQKNGRGEWRTGGRMEVGEG
jgi:hypothetical protein